MDRLEQLEANLKEYVEMDPKAPGYDQETTDLAISFTMKKIAGYEMARFAKVGMKFKHMNKSMLEQFPIVDDFYKTMIINFQKGAISIDEMNDVFSFDNEEIIEAVYGEFLK